MCETKVSLVSIYLSIYLSILSSVFFLSPFVSMRHCARASVLVPVLCHSWLIFDVQTTDLHAHFIERIDLQCKFNAKLDPYFTFYLSSSTESFCLTVQRWRVTKKKNSNQKPKLWPPLDFFWSPENPDK